MNIHAGLGVAVREYPLRWKEGAKTCTGSADYLLYADGRAIGVVEAKPAGYPLRGVEPQSKQYTDGLPEGIPNYRLPLPFAYESTGKITHFTNGLDPDHRSREVFTFHSPEELKRLVELQCQLRSNLREMPVLEPGRLWPVQRDAITNLERSLAANRPRALIQMATGSGKTYTACSFCYRLFGFNGAFYYGRAPGAGRAPALRAQPTRGRGSGHDRLGDRDPRDHAGRALEERPDGAALRRAAAGQAQRRRTAGTASETRMRPEEPGGLSGHKRCRGLLSITTVIESYPESYALLCE